MLSNDGWALPVTWNPFIPKYWLNIKILKTPSGQSQKWKGLGFVQAHGVWEWTKEDRSDRQGPGDWGQRQAQKSLLGQSRASICTCSSVLFQSRPELTKINFTVVEQIGFPHPQPINILCPKEAPNWLLGTIWVDGLCSCGKLRAWVTPQTTSPPVIAPLLKWSTETPLAKCPCLWTPRDRIQTVFDGKPIAQGFSALSSSKEGKKACFQGTTKKPSVCSDFCLSANLGVPREFGECCCYCYSSLFIDLLKYIMYWETVMFMGI